MGKDGQFGRHGVRVVKLERMEKNVKFGRYGGNMVGVGKVGRKKRVVRN